MTSWVFVPSCFRIIKYFFFFSLLLMETEQAHCALSQVCILQEKEEEDKNKTIC